MAKHVDLIKNDLLAGYQERVAQIRLVGGNGARKLEVDAPDPKWREIALRPLPGLDPSSEPERFFSMLSSRLKGSHLSATTPHYEKDCPFHGRDRIPAKQSRI